MTGDLDDMLSRIKAVLPTHWFADVSATLDGVLAGPASIWALLYDQLNYARLQTRLASASDNWLDWIAQDFFGTRVVRRLSEPDDAMRRRISRELLRERATRAALTAALVDITGRTPVIFEPARPTDTGGWGIALAYGTGASGGAGGWGSLLLPYQCFVTAYRPAGSGIATVAGYGTGGPVEYASLTMIEGQVNDPDIVAAVADVMPLASIAWTRISN